MPVLSSCTPERKTKTKFCASWNVVYILSNMYVSKREFSCNPNFSTCGTWSATVWPPHRLCYRPAVFFHHLHVIALSLACGITRLTFKKYDYYNFYSFFNCVSRESGSIWSERIGAHLLSSLTFPWHLSSLHGYDIRCRLCAGAL